MDDLIVCASSQSIDTSLRCFILVSRNRCIRCYDELDWCESQCGSVVVDALLFAAPVHLGGTKRTIDEKINAKLCGVKAVVL